MPAAGKDGCARQPEETASGQLKEGGSAPVRGTDRGARLLLGGWVLFLLACHLALPREAFFSGDAALKRLQTFALLRSGGRSVALSDESLALDPSGAFTPFRPPSTFRDERGQVQAVFPIAFALLNAPLSVFFGSFGFYLPALIGGLLSAWFTVRIARRVAGPRAGTAAAALVISATPLTFYSLTIWEHALGCALILGAVDRLLACPGSRRHGLAAGMLFGIAALLRVDALLLLGAAVLALRRQEEHKPVIFPLVSGALPGTVLLLFLNQHYTGRWLPQVSENWRSALGGAWLGSMLLAAFRRVGHFLAAANRALTPDSRTIDLVVPTGGSNPFLYTTALGVGLAALAAAIWSRKSRSRGAAGLSTPSPAADSRLRSIVIVWLVVRLLYVLSFAGDGDPLVGVLHSGGILFFDPLLPFLLVTRTGSPRSPRGWLLRFCVYGFLAIAATAPNYGGMQYGLRYLLPLLPLLVVLGVAACQDLLRAAGGQAGAWRRLILCAVIMGCLIQARGIQILAAKRWNNARATSAIARSNAAWVTGYEWWIPFNSGIGVSRKRFLTCDTPEELLRLLDILLERGENRLLVVLQGAQERLVLPSSARERFEIRASRQRLDHPLTHYFDLTLFELTFARRGSAAG
jgi:hypothetical protein